MSPSPRISSYALAAVTALRGQSASLATAESLTGGALASAITDVPGSSHMFRGGVVAYDATVKEQLLHVPAELLATRGPVDPQVAADMAAGAARIFTAEIAVATTGVAGPESHGGHSPGLVYIGWRSRKSHGVIKADLRGDRSVIREATVAISLQIITQCLHGVHIDLGTIECVDAITEVGEGAE